LLRDALGELEDLTLNIWGIAPNALKPGDRLLELTLPDIFLSSLVVLCQVFLTQGAKEKKVVGDTEQDQD
jgi:hypothetical protein